MLDKLQRLILLNDFYGVLLTERQQEVMRLYYEEDLTLSEVAEMMSVTRQAVFDLIKRTEKILEEYESKLGLVDRFLRAREKMCEAYRLLTETGCQEKKVTKAREILKELLEQEGLG